MFFEKDLDQNGFSAFIFTFFLSPVDAAKFNLKYLLKKVFRGLSWEIEFWHKWFDTG
jgi:hypothetical protein